MASKSNADAGRPAQALDRHVAEALISATVQLLRDRPRGEIAIREIAAAAGVSKAMVGYYFNNKESLFEIVLENFMNDLLTAYRELEAEIEHLDPRKINPTRMLIAAISRIYADHQASLRCLISEISFNSELKQHYLERLVARPTKVLQRIIQHFIDLGIYRHDLDPVHAALTLEWTLSHEAMTGCISSPLFKLSSGALGLEKWTDHIAKVLEQGFAGVFCRST